MTDFIHAGRIEMAERRVELLEGERIQRFKLRIEKIRRNKEADTFQKRDLHLRKVA